MGEFLHMGGYAAYVWSSYALGALFLVGMLILSLRRLKGRQADLARLEAARPRRRRDAAAGEEAVP